VLYALLFLPALVAIALVWLRPRHKPRVLAEAVPPPATISGADELDERAVADLEQLAEKLEAAAASLERIA